MFRLDPAAKVWLILGKTEAGRKPRFAARPCTCMRKAINGLSGLVANQLAMDPMSGHYFVFAGKTRATIKVLYWDRNGYSLWYKRLEVDKFRWPRNSDEARAVTGEQLQWLLAGLDWDRAHPNRRYSA